MNTPADLADTGLFLKTALKCFGRKNGQVYLAEPSLYDCVIAPVERFLKDENVPFYFGRRLHRIKENKLTFLTAAKLILNITIKSFWPLIRKTCRA